jgi:NodT family efflux transporter outer membrane factor (OMF) lipoprotein
MRVFALAAVLLTGDPNLDELIRDALTNNLDLRVAMARVREARAVRGITASRGGVQFDGRASAIEARDNLFDAAFDASWEIDFFGGIRHDIKAAVAQVEAVEEARRDLEITLTAEVARNYVELRGAQRRIEVLDARIATLMDTRDILRARYEGGLATELDVARSEALLEDTRAARPALEYAVSAAIHRLEVLTTRRLGVRWRQPPLSYPDLKAAADAAALRNRPDVRRTERELAAATARIDVARAGFFPRIVLFGGVGRRSDGVSANYWSFGPALHWPLLTGGRVRSQIEARKAQRDQASAVYEQTVLGATEDFENALASQARDERERKSLTAAVAAARRAVDLAEARYRGGLDNFLTVLDAQRTLRDGEDRLAAAETHVALSAIALYKAVGGSFSDSAR